MVSFLLQRCTDTKRERGKKFNKYLSRRVFSIVQEMYLTQVQNYIRGMNERKSKAKKKKNEE